MWAQWQRDVRALRTRLGRWLNRLLVIRQPQSRWRGRALLLYHLCTWVGVFWLLRPEPLRSGPLGLWAYAVQEPSAVPQRLLQGVQLLLMNPKAWLIALALWMPFYLGRRFAAFYLDDIYELSLQIGGEGARAGTDGVWVAERFIRQAAFAADYTERLVIRQGEVVNPSSPVFLIGGPGRVIVASDSAALFERIDGHSDVIGPTPLPRLVDEGILGRWVEGVPIEGFERLRRIVDLRDHTVTLDLTTRSLDGIPVRVERVRLLYSIYRGERPLSRAEPYPFAPMAVERLVYSERGVPRRTGDALPVSDDPRRRQRSAAHVTESMRRTARAELNRFIGSQTLDEFLASIGEPEAEALRQADDQLRTQPGAETIPVFSSPDPPRFVPREEVARRFQRFTRGHKDEAARQRGITLEWIDIGRWEVPIPRVQQQYLRAWEIARENRRRGAPEALDRTFREAWLSTLRRHLEDVLQEFTTQWEDKRPVDEVVRHLLQHVRVLVRDGLALPEIPAERRAQLSVLLRRLDALLVRRPERETGP